MPKRFALAIGIILVVAGIVAMVLFGRSRGHHHGHLGLPVDQLAEVRAA